MRDITIPTSRLTNTGESGKALIKRGLRHATTTTEKVQDFVKGLRDDFEEEES